LFQRNKAPRLKQRIGIGYLPLRCQEMRIGIHEKTPAGDAIPLELRSAGRFEVRSSQVRSGVWHLVELADWAWGLLLLNEPALARQDKTRIIPAAMRTGSKLSKWGDLLHCIDSQPPQYSNRLVDGSPGIQDCWQPTTAAVSLSATMSLPSLQRCDVAIKLARSGEPALCFSLALRPCHFEPIHLGARASIELCGDHATRGSWPHPLYIDAPCKSPAL